MASRPGFIGDPSHERRTDIEDQLVAPREMTNGTWRRDSREGHLLESAVS